MGMLEIDILKFPDGERRAENNLRTLRKTDERWGILRTREADGQKKPLISYTEWISIEGKVRENSL